MLARRAMRRLFLSLGLFFALLGASLHVEAAEHSWAESVASQMAHQADGDSRDGENQKSAEHGSLCHHHCPNAALEQMRAAPLLALTSTDHMSAIVAPLNSLHPRPPVEPPAA